MASSVLLASTLARVVLGILANAALSGATTVMLLAELSVSTRPAFVAAATSVDSRGLCDAAVPTGAADMPLKLPDPEDGTDEQPGPNGAVAVPALLDGIADDDDGVAAGVLLAEDAAVDPLDPQAAAPSARPEPAAVMIRAL